MKNINEITKEEEFETEIKDIEENGIIFLKFKNQDSTPQEAVNLNDLEKKPLDNEKKEKQYYFEIEGGKKFAEIFEPNDTLSFVREKLNEKISNEMVFIHNGYEIDQKNEDQLTLSLIEKNSKILLKKSLDICPAPTLKRNMPINGSIEVSDINGLKIYKYPEVKFTDEDDLRAISLMVLDKLAVERQHY